MRSEAISLPDTDVDKATSLDADGTSDADTCVRMIRMLDEQIAELEHATQTIQAIRAKWCERLGVVATGSKPNPKTRAARGSIKYSVLSVLSQDLEGLTLSDLDAKLSANGATVNRQSLKLTLTRLKKDGRVRHEGNRWHIASAGTPCLTRS